MNDKTDNRMHLCWVESFPLASSSSFLFPQVPPSLILDGLLVRSSVDRLGFVLEPARPQGDGEQEVRQPHYPPLRPPAGGLGHVVLHELNFTIFS